MDKKEELIRRAERDHGGGPEKEEESRPQVP